jgi:hypothetical protein
VDAEGSGDFRFDLNSRLSTYRHASAQNQSECSSCSAPDGRIYGKIHAIILNGYTLVGQKELEDGPALAGCVATANPHAAAVTVDDLRAHPEAEAGSTDAFRGEECGVEVLHRLWGDASSGVCKCQDDALAVGSPLGRFPAANKEPPPGSVHGIE